MGVKYTPIPTFEVAQAFASTTIGFGLRDMRPDPWAVGIFQKDGFVVRTSDNVGQYCSTQVGDLLARAGARFSDPPMALVEAELLEFRVIEAGRYHGEARIRVVVRHGDGPAWSQTYIGKARRWGRTHSPDNFNVTLANALADAVKQLLNDVEFGRALMARIPGPASHVGA